MKALFILVMFVLLVACTDQTERITENPLIEKDDEFVNTEKTLEKPVLEEEKKPSYLIHLIDPNTEETITTISTKELGFHTDYANYVNQIELLAKDLARGTESREGYDRRMVLDFVNEKGELVEGTPMLVLKESELIERILAVSPDGGNVELPLYLTETGYDRTEFDTLDEVIVASYTTYYDSSVSGRAHNIKRSSDAISRVIVGVDDYFSFNTTVGPRTKETGYQEALEIINGEFVTGIGGGICQTSSTLFNAVDQLGVSYVERHHHSRDIGYVPRGRDATVSYGTLDFRFQNTTGIPFMIVSTTSGNSITVEIRTSQEYVDH
ncbi:VanW family protein [Ureibacillus sinduriensis]|uniref:VanW family protein n=1 Tax=Ureibacillus sinduriensis BLB-1 = JCM 15800 TaxID=1384057 RepID=A0A0A3HX42_9BACL|nr:VanW family protein [Ureibacillus sinduriensis]KGR74933.1 VanW family protein [Ureibacillus sinduriensis BLB-1 = JCM 15800]